MPKYKVKVLSTFTKDDQKLLFKLGYRWTSGGQTVYPEYGDTKCLYLYDDMCMSRDITANSRRFTDDNGIEIDYFLLFTAGQIVPIQLPKITTSDIPGKINLCKEISITEGIGMSKYRRQKMHYSVFTKDKDIDYKGLIYQEYKVLDQGGTKDERPLVREAIKKEIDRVSVRIMTGTFDVNAGYNIKLAAIQNNLNRTKSEIQVGNPIKLVNVIAYYQWEQLTNKPIETHEWIKQYLTEAAFNAKHRVVLFSSNKREIAINNGKIHLHENKNHEISYTCDIKYDDATKKFYF